MAWTPVDPANCPPLPEITRNFVTGEQLNAARDHFRCKAMDARGKISVSAMRAALDQAGRWVRNQQAKYVSRDVQTRAIDAGTIDAPGTPAPLPVRYTGPTVTVTRRPPTDDGRGQSKPPEIQPAQPASAPVLSMALAGPTTTTEERSMIGAIGALPGVMGGIGSIGTTISGLLGGGGKSKCPGPYNYVEGVGCVPKSDFSARTTTTCPPGYRWNGSTCVEEGFGGTVARVLPGGSTGTAADVYGQAVVGAFGMPALQPAQVGTVTRQDGSTGPIYRCPPGAVLGKDDLCYHKIPNSFRKWPKAPRPVLSASDMKTIRKVNSLQSRVKKAAQVTGFTCKKR